MCKLIFKILKENIVAFALIVGGGVALGVSLRFSVLFDALLSFGILLVSLGFSLLTAWASDKENAEIKESLNRIEEKLQTKPIPQVPIPVDEKGKSEKKKLSIEDSIAFLTAVLVFAAIFSMGIQILTLPLSSGTQIAGIFLLLAFLATVISLMMNYTKKGFWDLIRK